jgi:ergothioneine biosynthesis protein EgtB
VDAPQALLADYQRVRKFTEALAAPLAIEDYVIQTMPDVSPTKWHLAHVTWFFETFVLSPNAPNYRPLNPLYAYLFNSYYESVGPRHPRPSRGLLSRPTVVDVYAYRAHVDEQMEELLNYADEALFARLAPIIVLGLHHEQQHQELLLTDIKHVLSFNALRPAYVNQATDAVVPLATGVEASRNLGWVARAGGLQQIGFEADSFAFDNESPRHVEYCEPFVLADRLVTSGDYLDFINDGGYQRPELWLSAGWGTVQEQGWEAPLYWERQDSQWLTFSLSGGMRPLDVREPVCHISYFEADAYARWADARLPTEAEWESVAVDASAEGNFVEGGLFHPTPLLDRPSSDRPSQMFGDVWEWTQSAYSPYPGFKPAAGAIGEYNGKFMCNQYVLRGGSCATSESHIRPTYRNFFPPDARWQFTGLRLARDSER